MSNTIRIALVAEGWTDRSVIEATIAALLAGRSYDLNLLQPEDPAATAPFGVKRPVGWGGVFRWCRESVNRAGQLRGDVLLASYDKVILHLDADVADGNYAGAHIQDAPDPNDLPCGQACPPPSATTNSLRVVLLRWAGETNTPPSVVLCIPSKSLEAWVLAAIYPQDAAVTNGNLECRATPANLLQAKPVNERLVRSGKKVRERYEARQADVTTAWPLVRQVCSEAERFSAEFYRRCACIVSRFHRRRRLSGMARGSGLCGPPSAPPARTPTRSAACWRRTFTGPASTLPASSG